jgi:hypothetical protein
VSNSKQVAKRSGKSVEGKLISAMNSTKHGILSPRPVVAAFESESSWRTYRQSILDALAPEGGVEQALAERVALNSWRLNRVIVYETETINALQDTLVDEMRKHKKLYPMLSAGDPDPDAPVQAERRRAIYADVCAICDENNNPGSASEHSLSAAGLSWVHEQAPYFAPLMARFQEDPATDEVEVEDELSRKADELQTALEAHLEVETAQKGERGFPTPRAMIERIEWLANAAGVADDEDYTATECVLERLHTEAKVELELAEEKVREFEQEVAAKRRMWILPNEDQLQKIARYESHISREMYRALHELEALQTRRAGGAAPLARLDVNGQTHERNGADE